MLLKNEDMVYINNLLILLILCMFTYFEKPFCQIRNVAYDFDHSIKNINDGNY